MAMGAAGILLPAPSIPSSHSSRFRLPQTPWAVGLRTPPQQRPRPHLHFVSHHFPPSRHLLLLRRRRTGKKGRWRGKAVYASLFGVGAPEALVIGVVALLVFGPKGLAEVARNLGKTLRAFQPTIRELQDVSREFKSTLEREIGLDEVPPSTNYRPTPTDNSQQPAVNQNAKPETAPYSSDELLKVTEEQLAASAAAAWKTQPPVSSEPQEAASTSETETKTKTGTKTEGTSSLGAGDAPASASESDPSPNTTIQ